MNSDLPARLDAEDATNLEKYSSAYQAEVTTCNVTEGYFFHAAQHKVALVAQHGHGKDVLDVCCGPGGYLFATQHAIRSGIGLDFHPRMVALANERRAALKADKLRFMQGNAKAIDLPDASVDVAYTYAVLYTFEDGERVVQEISRVLRPHGVAILEFGNLCSMNTVVARAYPELATPHHIPIREMRGQLARSGLVPFDWQRFQILPYWGHRPRYLRVLHSLRWSRLMSRRVGGRMLDQIVSEWPLFKLFAFRHIVVARKSGATG